MPRPAELVLLSILVLASPTLVCGQEDRPTPTSDRAEQKTLIVTTKAKSHSVVAVPPARSVTMNLKAEKKPSTNAIDLPSWIAKEAALNGLQSEDILPWHIVVSYDQFDEDGDNVHSGVYEEYWAGAKSTSAHTRAITSTKPTMRLTRACFVRGTNSGPTVHSHRSGPRSLLHSNTRPPFRVFMQET